MCVCLLCFGVFPDGLLLLVACREWAALLDICSTSKAGGDGAGFGDILQVAFDINDISFLSRIATLPQTLHRDMPLTPLPRRRILTK